MHGSISIFSLTGVLKSYGNWSATSESFVYCIIKWVPCRQTLPCSDHKLKWLVCFVLVIPRASSFFHKFQFFNFDNMYCSVILKEVIFIFRIVWCVSDLTSYYNFNASSYIAERHWWMNPWHHSVSFLVKRLFICLNLFVFIWIWLLFVKFPLNSLVLLLKNQIK